jgi:predicted RNA-binding protein YlqC (UPF0109 family)
MTDVEDLDDDDLDDDDELEDDDDDLDEDEDEDDEDEDDEDDEDEDDGAGFDPNRVSGATGKAVLEYLLEQLVDEPEAIEVDTVERRDGLLFEVRVASGDMGRVIGRRGRTADAIRMVVRAAAARDDVDAEVEFVD